MKQSDFKLFMVFSFLLGMAAGAGAYSGIDNTPKKCEVKECNSRSVVEMLRKQNNSLSSWQLLQLAIAKTESEFNSLAVGTAQDYGIYQITPIYVKEVNRLIGDEVYQHSEAFSVRKSVEMFNTLQFYKNPTHDLELAIYYHNKSPFYKQRVLQNYEFVKRYEDLRQVLVSFDYNDR